MISPLQHLFILLFAWLICQVIKTRDSVHVLTVLGGLACVVYAPVAALVIALVILQGVLWVSVLCRLERSSKWRQYGPYLLLPNLLWVDFDNLLLGLNVATLGISFSTIRIFMTTKQLVSARKPPQTAESYWIAVSGFYLPALVIGPVFSGLDLRKQYDARTDVQVELRDHRMILQGLILAILVSPFLAAPMNAPSQLPIMFAAPLLFLQLFAAFWGQSLIAEHSSRLFGYRLPVNFDRPWQATTPKDFWARWHRSMAQFVLQYIFLPLNLLGVGPRLATIAAFVFMGLWHNLSIGYMIWGVCHGIMLAFSPNEMPSGPRAILMRLGLWVVVITLSYIANYSLLS